MKSMSDTYKKQRLDQKGMVSFLVTFIMLLVVSLIIVGFTRVASQNRREALDRQLSTQAFYAAESGINAFLAAAKTNPGLLTDAKDTCGGAAYEKSLSTDPDVQVTCVLVDPTVPYLEDTGIETGSSHIFTIDPRDPNTGNQTRLSRLVFVWDSKDGGSSTNKTGCPNNANNFPASYTNCDYGMLRIDLTKEPVAPSLTADSLAANTRSITMQPMQPTAGAGSWVNAAYSASVRAYRGLARCVTAPVGQNIGGVDVPADSCAAVVNVSPAEVAKYYARVSMLYNGASNLRVYALNGTTQLDFAGAQVLIDSTGKAVDVLRRVQVRVPLDKSSGEGVAPFAAYSESGVCKRFTVAGTTFEDACNPPTGSEGDSDYTPCGGRCGPGGGNSSLAYWYKVWFRVTSVNDVSRIENCTWNWGDGSRNQIETIEDPNQCVAGSQREHNFPVRPPKGKCYTVTVRFTVKLTGGVTKISDQDYYIPFSPSNRPHCPGH